MLFPHGGRTHSTRRLYRLHFVFTQHAAQEGRPPRSVPRAPAAGAFSWLAGTSPHEATLTCPSPRWRTPGSFPAFAVTDRDPRLRFVSAGHVPRFLGEQPGAHTRVRGPSASGADAPLPSEGVGLAGEPPLPPDPKGTQYLPSAHSEPRSQRAGGGLLGGSPGACQPHRAGMSECPPRCLRQKTEQQPHEVRPCRKSPPPAAHVPPHACTGTPGS